MHKLREKKLVFLYKITTNTYTREGNFLLFPNCAETQIDENFLRLIVYLKRALFVARFQHVRCKM